MKHRKWLILLLVCALGIGSAYAGRQASQLIQRFQTYMRICTGGELLLGGDPNDAPSTFDAKIFPLGPGSGTIASGASSESVTVTGAEVGDLAFVSVHIALVSTATLYTTITATNTLFVGIGGNAEADTPFSYWVVGQ